jgi:hypothetical protein
MLAADQPEQRGGEKGADEERPVPGDIAAAPGPQVAVINTVGHARGDRTGHRGGNARKLATVATKERLANLRIGAAPMRGVDFASFVALAKVKTLARAEKGGRGKEPAGGKPRPGPRFRGNPR